MIQNRVTQQTTSSKFSSSIFRRKCWLGTLCVIVILVMGVGILFTAHQFYLDAGGQGWLKRRKLPIQASETDRAQLYLPMRQVQTFRRSSIFERQGIAIPFYTCGDQQASCDSFQQPDICCPVGTTCFRTTFTNSGIYCCNATASDFQCRVTKLDSPKCMVPLVECSKETGGGCCPSTTECSPNGCVLVKNASIISSISTASFTSSGASQSTQLPPSTTSINLGVPVTITTTIFEAPAATVTLAKEGEVATARAGAGNNMRMRMWIPYRGGIIFLFCIALIMDRL